MELRSTSLDSEDAAICNKRSSHFIQVLLKSDALSAVQTFKSTFKRPRKRKSWLVPRKKRAHKLHYIEWSAKFGSTRTWAKFRQGYRERRDRKVEKSSTETNEQKVAKVQKSKVLSYEVSTQGKNIRRAGSSRQSENRLLFEDSPEEKSDSKVLRSGKLVNPPPFEESPKSVTKVGRSKSPSFEERQLAESERRVLRPRESYGPLFTQATPNTKERSPRKVKSIRTDDQTSISNITISPENPTVDKQQNPEELSSATNVDSIQNVEIIDEIDLTYDSCDSPQAPEPSNTEPTVTNSPTLDQSFVISPGIEVEEQPQPCPVIRPAYKYFCQFCNKGFPTPSKLSRHSLGKFHRDQVLTLSQQEVETNIEITTDLAGHIGANEIAQVPQHWCTVCNKAFMVPSKLVRHKYTIEHTEKLLYDNPNHYTCDFCGLFFEKGTDLLNHRSTTHQVPLLKHTCKYCNFSSLSSRELQCHMSFLHVGQWPCNSCGANFATDSALNVHITNAHKRNRNSVWTTNCKLCLESFCTPVDLWRHQTECQKKQMGESKPNIVECGQCGRAFHSQSFLNSHLKVHMKQESRAKLMV